MTGIIFGNKVCGRRAHLEWEHRCWTTKKNSGHDEEKKTSEEMGLLFCSFCTVLSYPAGRFWSTGRMFDTPVVKVYLIYVKVYVICVSNDFNVFVFPQRQPAVRPSTCEDVSGCSFL